MAEPFKNLINPDVVQRVADLVAPNVPRFKKKDFVAEIVADLDRLELMERVDRIALALHTHLPKDYPGALQGLLASIPPPPKPGEPGSIVFLPIVQFVGTYGVEHPELSLPALERMTCFASAEFAVRPFIVRHQKLTLARMHAWAGHADARVRRLASEGSRPRLPWGIRLAELVRDPSPTLPILERLKDDPDEVVRRSVANHLNDIAKDHPDRVVEIATVWSKAASPGTREIIKHGLRTLVKKGHAGALALLGFGVDAPFEVSGLTLSPSRVEIGEEVAFSFQLRSRAKKAQSFSVDYAVHHVKKDGRRTPKVFKLAKPMLGPGEETTLEKRHSMQKVTVRDYHPGEHLIEVLVNGQSGGQVAFELVVPAAKTRGSRAKGRKATGG